MDIRFPTEDSTQFADVSAPSGNHGCAQAASRDSSIAYWRRYLAPPLPLLDLPTDRSRPTTLRAVDAQHAFQSTEKLIAAIGPAASADEHHLFATLLAGFATLLARYSGQSELLIGWSNGAATQALPLRVDLSGNRIFSELVADIREDLDAMAAYRGLGLADLAEQMGLGRQADDFPLGAMLSYIDEQVESNAGHSNGESSTCRDAAPARADLVLTIIRKPGGCEAAIRFRSDLFDADRIQRMEGHFAELLAAAQRKPETPVAQLPLLTPAELAQLDEWNQTTTDYPRNATIAQLFERQVDATPGAPALLFGDGHWSYAELNDRADQIAERLGRIGVRTGVAVGVFLERSPELIAALLGILKAGGIYVPLDPSNPPERVQFMSLDADVRVVLANSESASRPLNWDVPVVLLDSTALPKPLRRAGHARPVAAEDPAYILFTSGSTGHPKGVAAPHRAVVRLVQNTNYLPFDGNHVFLQYANASFDAATLEIWGPLLNGAQLAIAAPGVLSLAELGQAIRRHHVTTLWLTSGLFHQMVDHRLSDLAGLKYLLAGGDVLSPEHVAKVRAGSPNVTLINGYGPTENTTFSTCHIMRGTEPSAAGAVPVGRPIANSQVYILDRQLRRVPIGVPGEICCGGDGLAIGYVNHPDLNEQAFFDYVTEDGRAQRLYKTGDLGRYRNDGAVDFLGRKDRQVKIRGFRIDPAEVEAQLCRHPAVRDAAVIVTVDATLRKQLTAYTAVGDAAAPAAKELQTFLAAHLPAYMVPSQFVCLQRLPLDPNGKVDRKRLPSAPRAARRAGGEQRPANLIERRLIGIWQTVFDVPEVSANDDFFELGGDSLMAVAVLARVESEFGASLQLTDLVEHPTVADLARLLGDAARFRTPLQAVEIQPGGSRPPLFFVPCIFASLMTIRTLAGRLDFEQPVFGLQPRGVDGREPPHESLSELADYYIQQLRAVQPRGPYYLMGYSLGGTVAFEMAHRLVAGGESIGLLMLVDAPFRCRPWLVRKCQEIVERLGPTGAALFRGLAGADASLPPEATGHNARMIEAHRRALNAWRAQPYRGPTVIFRPLKRPHSLKSWMDRITLDWKRYGLVDRETPVLWSPGDHATMFSNPNVDVLAELVSQQLDLAFAQPAPAASFHAPPAAKPSR